MKSGIISIAKPCSENWGAMSPSEKGRFCGKCTKEVIDFTNMSADQVVDCLTNNSGKKICGLFRNNQLGKAKSNKRIKTAFNPVISWTRFTVIMFLGSVFSIMGCEKPSKSITLKPILQPTKPTVKKEIIAPKEEPLLETLEIQTTKGEACFIEDIEEGQP